MNKFVLSFFIAAAGASSVMASVPLQHAMNRSDRFSSLKVRPLRHPGRSDKSDREIHRHPAKLANQTPRLNVPSDANSLDAFGYVTDSYYWDFVPQWVELTESGYNVIWDDTDYWMQGEVKLDNGWVRDGNLCGYASQLQFGQYLTGYYYKEFNLTDGNSTTIELDFDSMNIFLSCAYNPQSNMIMGFGLDLEGHRCILKAPANKPAEVSVVKTLAEDDVKDYILSLTWNAAEEAIIGITLDHRLITLNADGSIETLAQISGLPKITDYYTGLCYDATERVYYWNVFDDNQAYIYSINPESGASTRKITMPDGEIFATLYCNSKIVTGNAPDRPSFEDFMFDGPATSGKVSFRLPEISADGNALSGVLSWTITLDGKPHTSGNGATPGDVVIADFSSLEQGMHTFGCYASVGDSEGAVYIVERYVGYDTPLAPQNVRISPTTISWDAVTAGVHEGYVNADGVKYLVYLDDKFLGETSDTEYEVSLDAESTIRLYQASVKAVADEMESEAGVSGKLAYGAALDLPVFIRPTADDFQMMTIVDGDGDGYTWNFVDDPLDADSPCLDSDYSHEITEAADDWIFLPAMNFDDPEAFYTITFEAKGRMTQLSPDEYFEVKIGTAATPESMTATILPETLCHRGFYDYEQYFQVPSAGEYYIGIHAMSAPMMFGVRVRDIKVEMSAVKAESPMAVSDLKAEPCAKGELAAIVDFILPEKSVSGANYDSDTRLEAKVTGSQEISVIGLPGESKSIKVPTVQGDNRIRVVVYNQELQGLPVETSVFTGIDVPLAPGRVWGSVSEDNIDVSLQWTAPEGGEHNGYIDPMRVSYAINAYNGMFGWMPFDYVGEGVTNYNYVGDYYDGLAYLRLGVSAETIAGTSKYLTATGFVVGSPYAIPLKENFDSADGAKIGPWISVGDTDCQWGFADLKDISYDWENVPGGAMVGIPGSAGIRSGISFPKFSTIDATGDKGVSVKLRVWAGAGAPSQMAVYGVTYGMDEPMLLGTIPAGMGWRETSLMLPGELLHRQWVDVRLQCNFNSKDQLCVVDDFEVDYTSGVTEVDDLSGKVYASRGAIVFDGYTGIEASICTLDGIKIVESTITSDHERIAIAPGIYLVHVGSHTFKLSVR